MSKTTIEIVLTEDGLKLVEKVHVPEDETKNTVSSIALPHGTVLDILEAITKRKGRQALASWSLEMKSSFRGSVVVE